MSAKGNHVSRAPNAISLGAFTFTEMKENSIYEE